jgi:hypothetical protein
VDGEIVPDIDHNSEIDLGKRIEAASQPGTTDPS